MFGVTLLLLAVVVIRTGRLPKPIGYLAGISGLAYIAQGWIVGSEGFAATAQLFFVAPIVLGSFGSSGSLSLPGGSGRRRADEVQVGREQRTAR